MTISRTVHRPTGPPWACVKQDPEWGVVWPCGCGGSPPGEAFGPKGEGRPAPETPERPDPPGWSPEPEWPPLRNPCLPVGYGPPGGHGGGSRRVEPPERSADPPPAGQERLGPQTMRADAPPCGKCATHDSGKVPSPVHPPGCGPGLPERAPGPPGRAYGFSRRRFGRPLSPDGFHRGPRKAVADGFPSRLVPGRTGSCRERARGDPPLTLWEHPHGQGSPPRIAGPPGEPSTRCPPGPDRVPAHPSVPASMREGGGSRAHGPPGAPFHSQQLKPGSRAPTRNRTRRQDAVADTNHQGG